MFTGVLGGSGGERKEREGSRTRDTLLSGSQSLVQLLCESTVGCRHHVGRGPESWPEVAQEDGDTRPAQAGVEAVIWLLSTALLQDSQDDRQTAAQRNV